MRYGVAPPSGGARLVLGARSPLRGEPCPRPCGSPHGPNGAGGDAPPNSQPYRHVRGAGVWPHILPRKNIHRSYTKNHLTLTTTRNTICTRYTWQSNHSYLIAGSKVMCAMQKSMHACGPSHAAGDLYKIVKDTSTSIGVRSPRNRAEGIKG